MTRIVLTYTLDPSETLDLCDRAMVDRFVATRLLPGLTVQPAQNASAHADEKDLEATAK